MTDGGTSQRSTPKRTHDARDAANAADGRIVVDLTRLPVTLRYAIALTVTAIVVAAAWYVGRGRPTPHWIVAYLVPGLGVAGLVLIVTGTIARILRR